MIVDTDTGAYYAYKNVSNSNDSAKITVVFENGSQSEATIQNPEIGKSYKFEIKEDHNSQPEISINSNFGNLEDDWICMGNGCYPEIPSNTSPEFVAKANELGFSKQEIYQMCSYGGTYEYEFSCYVDESDNAIVEFYTSQHELVKPMSVSAYELTDLMKINLSSRNIDFSLGVTGSITDDGWFMNADEDIRSSDCTIYYSSSNSSSSSMSLDAQLHINVSEKNFSHIENCALSNESYTKDMISHVISDVFSSETSYWHALFQKVNIIKH